MTEMTLKAWLGNPDVSRQGSTVDESGPPHSSECGRASRFWAWGLDPGPEGPKGSGPGAWLFKTKEAKGPQGPKGPATKSQVELRARGPENVFWNLTHTSFKLNACVLPSSPYELKIGSHFGLPWGRPWGPFGLPWGPFGLPWDPFGYKLSLRKPMEGAREAECGP